MTASGPELRVLDGPDQVARAAAEIFASSAAAAAERGRFAVALSGGTTPRATYRLLAGEPYRSRIPWPAVQVFWGDERHVPPDHPDSNYRMAREALLAHVPIPDGAVHRVPTEDPDPTAAAGAYERELERVLGAGGESPPRFDLILLGMGADGHTASLFPGGAAVRERRRLVVAERVDEVGGWRITLTLPVLNAAARVVFLVSGAEKAEAVRSVLGPDAGTEPLPASLVRPRQGSLVWLVDAAAARLLAPTGPPQARP